MANAEARRVGWHLAQLDALRGIAILGVLLVHCSNDIGLGDTAVYLAHWGQRGVQMFFIASAFTLFLSEENRRFELAPTRNFFLRRFFRIAPMYYAALIAAIFVFPWNMGGAGHTLLAFLFLHGLNPVAMGQGAPGGWSIGDEALFYLCLPLLFRAIRSLKTALWWFAIAAPIGYMLARVLSKAHPGLTKEYFAFTAFWVEFPVFLLGIVTFYFVKELQPESEESRRNLSVCLLLGAAFLFLALGGADNKNPYLSSSVCFLVVLALVVKPWGWLVNGFTILLGKVSFSVYLLHFFIWLPLRDWLMVHGWLARLVPTHFFLLQLAVVPTLAVLASIVTWRLIEVPGITLGKRVIAALEHRQQQRQTSASIRDLPEMRDTPSAQF